MVYAERRRPTHLPAATLGPAVNPRPQVLTHAIISKTIQESQDKATLTFTRLNLVEIPDAAVQELAQIGTDNFDGSTTVQRLALVVNRLSTLPASFARLTHLRYLNLRSNVFTHFPEAVTRMPSLDVLDMSRNKLKTFPAQPGSLLRLRVLHLGRNRLVALPSYFPEFRDLTVLRIEHNPIEWPPAPVLASLVNGDDQVAMANWVQYMRDWTREHGGLQNPIFSPSLVDIGRGEEDYKSRLHARNPSIESLGSQYSSVSPAPSHPSSPRHPPPEQPSESPSPDPSLHTPESSLEDHDPLASASQQHSRNASFSVGSRQQPNGSTAALAPKKSLPELRSLQLTSGDRKGQQNWPPFPRQRSSPPRASPSETTPVDADASTSVQPPPMDTERNSYFKRLSTLPPSTIAKTVPESLLVVIDAARGILFALSQIYSALRHYIVFAINDRLSSVLVKVLDPASQYLSRFITALDRFDGLCRRGMPPAAACRGVLESCRDNVSVFMKVVGVLQIQLKVLAGSDDVRYTRTLLLMLYGSTAELSNSWKMMAPQIEAVQDFIKDKRTAHPPVPAVPRGLTTVRPILPIAENEESSSSSSAGTAMARAQTPAGRVRSAARRHAGSFSTRDVQLGRTMPMGPQPSTGTTGTVLPLSIQSPSPSGLALKAALRQNTGLSSPHSSHSHNSSSSHSHSTSSHGREDPFYLSHGILSPKMNPVSDKDKLVDASMLNSMEESTELAISVWKLVDDVFEHAGEVGALGREQLHVAEAVTYRLKSNIRAVLDGADSDAFSVPLWEDANAFGKHVVNVASFVRKASTEYGVQLDPYLRTNLQKLIRSTQEFATLSQFSSFAVGKPPPSPAAPTHPLLSPTGMDDRSTSSHGSHGHTPNLMQAASYGYGNPVQQYAPPPPPPQLFSTSSGSGGGTVTPAWRNRSATSTPPSTVSSPPPQQQYQHQPPVPPFHHERTARPSTGSGGSMAGVGTMYPPFIPIPPAQNGLAWDPPPPRPGPPSHFRMGHPGSPALGRSRHGGGVVGYKEPD